MGTLGQGAMHFVPKCVLLSLNDQVSYVLFCCIIWGSVIRFILLYYLRECPTFYFAVLFEGVSYVLFCCIIWWSVLCFIFLYYLRECPMFYFRVLFDGVSYILFCCIISESSPFLSSIQESLSRLLLHMPSKFTFTELMDKWVNLVLLYSKIILCS
jgi:hypothetical protein